MSEETLDPGQTAPDGRHTFRPHDHVTAPSIGQLYTDYRPARPQAREHTVTCNQDRTGQPIETTTPPGTSVWVQENDRAWRTWTKGFPFRDGPYWFVVVEGRGYCIQILRHVVYAAPYRGLPRPHLMRTCGGVMVVFGCAELAAWLIARGPTAPYRDMIRTVLYGIAIPVLVAGFLAWQAWDRPGGWRDDVSDLQNGRLVVDQYSLIRMLVVGLIFFALLGNL